MVNSSGVELLIFYFPPVPQAPLGVIQRLHLRCILSLHIIFNYQFRTNLEISESWVQKPIVINVYLFTNFYIEQNFQIVTK